MTFLTRDDETNARLWFGQKPSLEDGIWKAACPHIQIGEELTRSLFRFFPATGYCYAVFAKAYRLEEV